MPVALLENRPAPFVGRQDELELLRQLFERAVAERSTHLVTVTGEPGVGKSRLVDEFLAEARARGRPLTALQGRCLPYGEGVTFWPVAGMVRARAGIAEADPSDVAEAKLREAVRAVVPQEPEVDWFVARLGPLVHSGPARLQDGAIEPTEWFAAWARFLEAVAAKVPLVAVFEDLHWAEALLLEFLEYLLDWATDVPLLIVCAARPELYDVNPGWGGGKRSSTTIALGALTEKETVTLLGELLSDTSLPAETEAALVERSGGNPLYAEQFVSMLTDRGILTRNGEGWRIEPGAEIPVPESAQALITARLGSLPPGHRTVLYNAAVIGRVFWAGAVAAMQGVARGWVELALRELSRRELVRAVRSSTIPGEAEFTFWHVLLRDVAYEQIPVGERADKHRAVAEWLERVAGTRAEEAAEVLAHHYGRAFELASAGPSADPASLAVLKDRTVRYLATSGDRAMRIDIPRAVLAFRQALALGPSGDQGRLSIQARLAEALALGGDLADAVGAFQEVIEGRRAAGDEAGAARVMLELSYVLWNQGWTAHSRQTLGAAVDLLERKPPGPVLARAYAQRGSDLFLQGRSGEALEWSERGLALATEFGLQEELVRSLEVRGMARCDLGEWDEGLSDLERALRTALDLDFGAEVVRASLNLATFLTPVAGLRRGLEVYRAGEAFAERRGLGALGMWIKAWSLGAMIDVGRWDEVLRRGAEVLAWSRQHGSGQIEVIVLMCRAEVLSHRGEVAEASALAAEFLPRARTIDDPQVLVPALGIAGTVAAGAGRIEEAVALVEEMDLTSRKRGAWTRSMVAQHAFRVAEAASRPDLASRAVEGLDERTARSRNWLLAAHAVGSEAGGGFDEAAGLYHEAARAWEEYGFALERARALRGAARCHRRAGRDQDAESAAADAKGILEMLGARSR